MMSAENKENDDDGDNNHPQQSVIRIPSQDTQRCEDELFCRMEVLNELQEQSTSVQVALDHLREHKKKSKSHGNRKEQHRRRRERRRQQKLNSTSTSTTVPTTPTSAPTATTTTTTITDINDNNTNFTASNVVPTHNQNIIHSHEQV